ncbi:hypothetical protein HAX54_024420 [Datura stramonium]|uniref:Uncharacterized protein n=1 Tax=Datura stramonium TaxID=4076 RepID=A0ABS8V0H1_DATST|nr:hypothetical protein [Datura stramonium]
MRSCFTFFLSVVMIAEILVCASSITRDGMTGNRAWNSSFIDAAAELDDINWEVTLANAGNTLSYKGLQRPPVCNAKIYGQCIGDKGSEKRPCTYYNNCIRDGSCT